MMMMKLFNLLILSAAVLSSLGLQRVEGRKLPDQQDRHALLRGADAHSSQSGCIGNDKFGCDKTSDCCDKSQACIDGFCFDCKTQSEYCSSSDSCCKGLTCKDRYCDKPCEYQCCSDEDCSGGKFCSNNPRCAFGKCVHCDTEDDCGNDENCDCKSGECVKIEPICKYQCCSDEDCPRDEFCSNNPRCAFGKCVHCTTKNDCGSGEICDCKSGQCVNIEPVCKGYDDSCKSSLECCKEPDLECRDGTCAYKCRSEGRSCDSRKKCCHPYVCKGDTCVKESTEPPCRDPGQTCSGSPPCCQNFECIDGWCEEPKPPCRERTETCSPSVSCCENLTCVDGKCVVDVPVTECLESVGDVCLADVECCPPLVCKENQCSQPQRSCSDVVNSTCSEQNVCCSGLECDDGHCVVIQPESETEPEPKGCVDSCIVPSDCCEGTGCELNRCIPMIEETLIRKKAKAALSLTCGIDMEPCDSSQQCCERYVCNGSVCGCAEKDEACEFVQCCAGFYCDEAEQICKVCLVTDAECQEPDECCHGYCDFSAVPSPKCKGCVNLGGDCSANAECCEGYQCITNGIKNVCSCGGIASQCPPFDCCTPVLSPLHCKEGFCVPCAATLGGVCDDDEDCCYGPNQYCDKSVPDPVTGTGTCMGCLTGACTPGDVCCQGYCNSAGQCADCLIYGEDCDPSDSKCCDKLYCDLDAHKCLCASETDICSPDIPCCTGLTCNEATGECECAGRFEDCRVNKCCEGLGCDNSGRCNCAELNHDCAFVSCCGDLICDPINWNCIEPVDPSEIKPPNTGGPGTGHIHIDINNIVIENIATEPEPQCFLENENCDTDDDCCYSWLYCDMAVGTCQVDVGDTVDDCHGYAGVHEEVPRDAIQVFYFPRYSGPPSWFHWETVIRPGGGQYSGANDDLPSPFYPRLGPYDSSALTVIETHMDWISEAGIGVVILSWRGEGSYEDRLVWNILDEADIHNLAVAFYIEPPVIEYGNATTVSLPEDYAKASVSYLIETYGCHHAVYRRDNHFMLLFSKAALGDKENVALWGSVWNELAVSGYEPVVIAPSTKLTNVIDGGWDGGFEFECSLSFSMIVTRDWPNLAYDFEKENKILYFTVCPGSNKKKRIDGAREQQVYRVDGAVYNRSWDSAATSAISLNANPVAVNSFNEWHIGTSIEPAISKTIDSYELHNETIEGYTYEDYNNTYGLTGSEAEFAYINGTKEHADDYILNVKLVDVNA